MKVNNKYILCQVGGYFSEEDKKSELREEAISLFDWNLNPVKKFKKKGYYRVSNDCRSVYFCQHHKDDLTLHEAGLNIK